MTLAVEPTSATTTVADAVEQAGNQPYEYIRRELVEPDWRRFPGWREVTEAQWRDAQWQRVHCVKNIKQLRTLMGDLLDERFYDDLAADQEQLATMSMLVPPQMMNTMAPNADLSELHRSLLRRPDPPVHDPGQVGP